MGQQTRIYLNCTECGKNYKSMQCTVDKNYAKFGKHLCQSCTRKGDRNPFYGYKFDENKIKEFSEIRKAYYSDEELGAQHRAEQSERWLGDKNPMWKGAGMRSDFTWRYKHLSIKVLARDDYTCSKCNVKYMDKLLRAHHKNSCDWCIEGRRDLDNMVTLCIPCHKEFHHMFKYGNNTEDQYLSFINKGSETIEKGESHLVE